MYEMVYTYVIIHIHLYVHFTMDTFVPVVTIQVILHSDTGHQGLPSVHINLYNTNADVCTPSKMSYKPRGDQLEDDKFYSSILSYTLKEY